MKNSQPIEGASSADLREFGQKDQDRMRLRNLLLEGADSAPTKPVDAAYFKRLRDKVLLIRNFNNIKDAT